jgi:Family of unknown function (DUF6232)
VTIFYRGPCVHITHKVFEVRCPTVRTYLIAELLDVYIVVDTPASISSARVGSTGMAGAVAVAIALGHAGGWQALETPTTTLGMVALFIVSLAVSGACWWVNPVEQELVAVYRGQLVTLHRSADPEEFGQVKRGLMRAIERLEDTG